MALEPDISTCKQPDGSAPILTVSIPGGLAINFGGLLAEVGPICINVYTACPNPLFLPAGKTETDTSENESPSSCSERESGTQPSVSIATGASRNAPRSSKMKVHPGRHGKTDRIETKPLKLSNPFKHPKPLKPPKPPKLLKHPKPLKPPKPPGKH
jgi:hypothetical protein